MCFNRHFLPNIPLYLIFDTLSQKGRNINYLGEYLLRSVCINRAVRSVVGYITCEGGHPVISPYVNYSFKHLLLVGRETLSAMNINDWMFSGAVIYFQRGRLLFSLVSSSVATPFGLQLNSRRLKQKEVFHYLKNIL